MRLRCDKHPRYVLLNLQLLFDSLVNLYAPLFQTHWARFKRFANQFPVADGVNAWTHLTRCYISTWILDLYCSNREAVRKISTLSFSWHYETEVPWFSWDCEYDEFLALVIASIRPTHIKGTMEDTLYIPLLREEPVCDDEKNNNPFQLQGWVFDCDLFHGLVDIMKETRAWKMSNTVVKDTLGSPCWLFDWHADYQVCAWFPSEGNFNMKDVTIAYIIGVACSPNLGPSDVDEWQPYPQGRNADNLDLTQVERLTPRRFYGSYEVRTADHRAPQVAAQPYGDPIPCAKGKRKSRATASTAGPSNDEPGTGSLSQEDLAPDHPQFRIVDWTYRYLVVLNFDPHSRSRSLRMIAQN
ncbi:hypothetical protein Dimus_032403 [Dionaea muscipula]